MSKTLIGIVTFGNLGFTQTAVRELRATVHRPHRIFIVIGDPLDEETRKWVGGEQIDFVMHRPHNKGFPSSINDLYDWAFRHSSSDQLIVMGNDVVPYPGAVDAMIDLADASDWEWICGSQFDAKSLVARYPETAEYFQGEALHFSDFSARPWDAHLAEFQREMETRRDVVEPDTLKDVRNLCLFKRSVFDRIGYADANFFPGGYFEDNDYQRRAVLAGVKGCGLPAAAYFHFWSRTIHQGGGDEANRFYFGRNAGYYAQKWGGAVGAETYGRPFNGVDFDAPSGVRLWADLRIGHRSGEDAIIAHWRGLRK